MAKRPTPKAPRKRSTNAAAAPDENSTAAPATTASIPFVPAQQSVPTGVAPVVSRSLGLEANGKLKEGVLRRFVFQTFGRARRTQDSPVMPDVFLRYIRLAEKQAAGRAPKDALIDLLLTPWSGVRPGLIAADLNERLSEESETLRKIARVALSGSRVVVGASFTTLVQHIVKMTGWWPRLFRSGIAKRAKKLGTTLEALLEADWTDLMRHEFIDTFDRIDRNLEKTGFAEGPGVNIELARYGALVGFISRLQETPSMEAKSQLASIAYKLGAPSLDDEEERELLADEAVARGDHPTQTPLDPTSDEREILRSMYREAQRLLWPKEYKFQNGIFMVSLNRQAAQSVFESRATVKADAAQNVFAINTAGIAFAVIDGGIDATHPGLVNEASPAIREFREKNLDGPIPPHLCLKNSRVLATYDFTILRDIVASAIYLDPQSNDSQGIPHDVPNRDTIIRLANVANNKEALAALANRGRKSRDLDWEIVRPLIEIRHDLDMAQVAENDGDDCETDDPPAVEGFYVSPGTDHGTHVAGILAGNRRKDPSSGGRDLIGMCPQLLIYDLRVFDQNGRGDEFAILCAIEFVGWLNRDRANPVVHGANLSLALAHDVDAFACGQTPICEACNHLVGSGTVVVTVAGNTGFDGGPSLERRSIGNGYRAISITDPGNADSVITVGSTHRRDPHLYGVSYFSARGPTGDGRRKPDLLAPGEKITSLTPNRGSRRMDGTSMAAPHVAGAAALLMARYPELIGRPGRIKEILKKTATDLGRESNFQGAGLLDTLRALQSV
jgi:serine protease AprX